LGTLAGGCALLVVVTGCAAESRIEPPRPPSREIRDFDIGAAEWYDVLTGETVRLRGGLAKRDLDPTAMPGGASWRVLGPPAYADLDGDGDEDVAIGLHADGGQMFSSAWYFWLWQDGSAVQVRRPIITTSRCDGIVESVVAKGAAVTVSVVLADGDDPCATSGSVPVTFDVGLRDGWPVRVAPEFGPVATCNERDLTETVLEPGEVQLRTWPDDASPPIGMPVEPDYVLIDDIHVSPYLEEYQSEWVLVFAALNEDESTSRVCGWVRRDEVLD
jgi:hypothetical protein